MLLPKRPRTLSLVKLDSGVTSAMLLPERSSISRLVKLDSGVTSATLLKERSRTLSLVKLDSGVTSDMLLTEKLKEKLANSSIRVVKYSEKLLNSSVMFTSHNLPAFPPRTNSVRLIANSSPVRSLIFSFDASRRVKVAISACVIGAPNALPRLFAMTSYRFASRMTTSVVLPPPGGGGGGGTPPLRV